jgi:Domain of unknown function (DUF5666)
MRRLALAGLVLFAVPTAAAQAAPQRGALLRVDRAHRKVEVVDARHVVHRYAVSGRLPRKLREGDLVSFRPRGKRIAGLRVTGSTRKLSFYATVVSSGHEGALLRLPDGRSWRIGQRQVRNRKPARSAGSVQINLEGLQADQVVLITLVTDGDGNISITIRLVPNGDPTDGEDQDVTGAVTSVDANSVSVQVDGQGEMTFQADPDLLDGLQVGDQVDVTYFTDDTGSLVADDIEWIDGSGGDQGDGSGGVGDSAGGDQGDVTGDVGTISGSPESGLVAGPRR